MKSESLSKKKILSLTVSELREKVVLNNLGGEKALKKEL
jgi:hypothetical protein